MCIQLVHTATSDLEFDIDSATEPDESLSAMSIYSHDLEKKPFSRPYAIGEMPMWPITLSLVLTRCIHHR